MESALPEPLRVQRGRRERRSASEPGVEGRRVLLLLLVTATAEAWSPWSPSSSSPQPAHRLDGARGGGGGGGAAAASPRAARAIGAPRSRPPRWVPRHSCCSCRYRVGGGSGPLGQPRATPRKAKALQTDKGWLPSGTGSRVLQQGLPFEGEEEEGGEARLRLVRPAILPRLHRVPLEAFRRERAARTRAGCRR